MKYNYNNKKIIMPINLAFFDGEKTEKATPKKRDKAREEGQVAKSTEILTAISIIFMFFALSIFAEYMYEGIQSLFLLNIDYMSNIDSNFDRIFILNYMIYMGVQIFLLVIPLFAVAMIIGVIANLIQVGWQITPKAIKPKFSKLNPISGFKRIFSLKSVLELFKSVTKFALIVLVVYNTIKDDIGTIPLVFEMTVIQGVMFFGDIIVRMGITVGVAYIAIALIDYTYVKLKHEKDLKMSKQDIKDEYKMSEGDPQVKGKIRQRMREASMRRMMQDLPEADVIITNPTHFAVAIKYDKSKSPAPIVIAKGADHLAKKIREVAKDNEIEIVENKPLARTLYATVDIGSEIPPELYKTVAEVLAYVYKLKNKT